MLDSSDQILITFNGEIYNHDDLRRELIALGSSFKSLSDTEVIIEAYRHWGVGALARLNGMFAFALWDERTQSLLLARDRLGKKPLYYFERDSHLSFASELPALLEEPSLPDEINEKAVIQFLSLGYLTTSECINPHAKRLPPGHFLLWKRGSVPQVSQYWDLAACFGKKEKYSSIAEAAEQLNVLLSDAVKIRLMSDVPLGAFLSGGIDSSTIVRQMCNYRAAVDCNTFSFGFKEETFNELASAQAVATTLGVSHHQSSMTEETLSNLARISECSGEPFADTSIIPMYHLSAFARQKVTVALSGDGADEIFGGYETYLADKLHHWLRWIPKSAIKAVEFMYKNSSRRDFGKVSTDYKILQFLRGCSLPYTHAHFSWRELFTREEIHQMVVPHLRSSVEHSHPLTQFQKYDSEVREAHYLDRSMYVDIKTWLVDDILVKVDRASMAHALEARAPFLDYRLVEFAAQLPPEYKVKGWSKKHILKVAQRGLLPHATLSQPKRGFNSPISFWLFGFLSNVCQDLVKNSPLLQYVSREAIRTTFENHISRKQDNSFKLFALIQLHFFLEAREKRVMAEAA